VNGPATAAPAGAARAAAATLIAIDWGTTSARGYRHDASGRVVGETSAALGIQQVRDGAYAGALATLLGDWAREGAPRIACGMIGSRQGWVEAPYRDCPAALDTLASGLVHAAEGVLAIVPGVTCVDAAGVPDVMRGEETQILGAIAGEDAPGRGRELVVLPGTHSKWALVDAGRIETFATFLSGELYAVLKDHSILGRMMAPGNAPAVVDAAAYERGVRRGLAATGPGASLLHDLFGARTLALFGALTAPAAADYLSGLVIGSEIREGRAWAQQHGADDGRALLVGAPALTARYAAAFDVAGVTATIGPADAAARGLWRIARRAGLLG
jgi:2-dehydro-3-deoxygalactonokinase